MVKYDILRSIAIATMALLLAVEAKSIDETDNRVLRGSLSKPGQFPYTVSVRTSGHVHYCGGVLISDHIVLTTAYCTQGEFSHPSNVTVVVGTQTLALEEGTSYAVSKIINHPEYNAKTIANDISAIRTVRKILFSKLVQPARLPTSDVAARTVATISGWGQMNVSFFFFFCRKLDLILNVPSFHWFFFRTIFHIYHMIYVT